MTFSINCDLGEGFGRYRLGDDAAIMATIDLANIACGYHAGDPAIIAETVRLASLHGTKAGAHPSLPDRQGFGRREMKLTRAETAAFVRYQIGAVKGFLDAARIGLSHVKPHGALYGMAARDEETAEAICDAAQGLCGTLLGLAGTAHEHVYLKRGFAFVAEFYADLEYTDDGTLIIGRQPLMRDPAAAAQRVMTAMRAGRTLSLDGKEIEIRASSVCVHSDSGNRIELVRAIRAAMASAVAA